MRFTKLSSLGLILKVGVAFANGGGGAPPAEHGGGGAAAAAVPRDRKEFVEKTNKLNSLATKLEEAEKHFAHVVHEKEEAHDAEAKAHHLKELAEIAKQRNADVLEYNKLKTDLTLRYPNQGERVNRHYRTHSAEELEHALATGPSLDDLLVDTKRMIDQKYAPLNPAPPPPTRHPAATLESAPKAPRLRLER